MFRFLNRELYELMRKKAGTLNQDTCLCFIHTRALVRVIPEYETAVTNKLWGNLSILQL